MANESRVGGQQESGEGRDLSCKDRRKGVNSLQYSVGPTKSFFVTLSYVGTLALELLTDLGRRTSEFPKGRGQGLLFSLLTPFVTVLLIPKYTWFNGIAPATHLNLTNY